MNESARERGSVNPLLISNAILAVLVVVLGGVMIWALTNYSDQKNNTDAKISKAVTVAKTSQSAQDEKDFIEREKSPYRQYIGPADLGKVTFNYPKTWSAYTAVSTDNTLDVYFHPGVVPTIEQDQQFATELKVINRASDDVLQTYLSRVTKGDLKSTPVVVNGFNGTRLDGAFSPSIKGSLVIFKLRDKTLTLQADAETFRGDFDSIILKSLDFNP